MAALTLSLSNSVVDGSMAAVKCRSPYAFGQIHLFCQLSPSLNKRQCQGIGGPAAQHLTESI